MLCIQLLLLRRSRRPMSNSPSLPAQPSVRIQFRECRQNRLSGKTDAPIAVENPPSDARLERAKIKAMRERHEPLEA